MENAVERLSNRVQHSINCRVFLRLPLDREGQFSAGFALLVVAMQEQRRRAGSVLRDDLQHSRCGLRFAIRSRPLIGSVSQFPAFSICFPTLIRRSLRCFPLAHTVVANEEQILTLSAIRNQIHLHQGTQIVFSLAAAWKSCYTQPLLLVARPMRQHRAQPGCGVSPHLYFLSYLLYLFLFLYFLFVYCWAKKLTRTAKGWLRLAKLYFARRFHCFRHPI